MDIANIFRRAWEITWKNKGLWVLGILANCSGGSSQSSGNAGRSPEIRFSEGDFPKLDNWIQSVPEDTWITIGVVAIVAIILLALIFWALSAIGNGGLISGFQLAEMGETPTLSRSFRQGIIHFWKLMAIQLIVGLSILVLVIASVIGGTIFSVLTLGIGAICVIPLMCLFIPLMILVSIFSTLTQIALIVEKLDIMTSFRRAWEIMRSNPGEIILMALILGVGGFIAGVILTAPMMLMALPLILGWIGAADINITSTITNTLVGILLYLPIMLVASGIVRTFTTGSWTLTYRSLMVKESVQQPA
jgi:hypothetical protein